MNAPRALESNPGKKRVFKILAHQDQKPMANPVKARKGKTQLRAQTKFGPPLELKPTGEFPYATEIEIRRRVGMLDDHLLAKYPQLVDELVPWLARRAEGGGDVDEGDLEDFLYSSLKAQPGSLEVSDIIQDLVNEGILFSSDWGTKVAGPGVGKPPPFTGAEPSVRWALINVGADPNRDDQLLAQLKSLPRDQNGVIDEADLTTMIDERLFTKQEFKPEEPDFLIEKLKEANVIVKAPGYGMLYFDEKVAGRSDPYVITFLKRKLSAAEKADDDKRFITDLKDLVREREDRVGRAGHYDQPPAGRKAASSYVAVPKSRQGKYRARPVQDLIPGDIVFEMGPVPQYAAQVVSVVPKGDWYTVTVKDGAGKEFTKRAKKGKLVAVEKDAPVPPFTPKYHPAERLKIDDPAVLHVLSFFEGSDWLSKQHRFPNCPKCVLGNKTVWEVLQSLGPKGRGITLAMLLEGAGRVEGAKHTGHWYRVDEQGYIDIEKETATSEDVKALAEVGVGSV